MKINPFSLKKAKELLEIQPNLLNHLVSKVKSQQRLNKLKNKMRSKENLNFLRKLEECKARQQLESHQVLLQKAKIQEKVEGKMIQL